MRTKGIHWNHQMKPKDEEFKKSKWFKRVKSERVLRKSSFRPEESGNDVFWLKSKHHKLSWKICRIASTQRKNMHPVEISLRCSSNFPYFFMFENRSKSWWWWKFAVILVNLSIQRFSANFLILLSNSQKSYSILSNSQRFSAILSNFQYFSAILSHSTFILIK